MTPEPINHYPAAAIKTSIDALELAYGYLRDKPAIEEKLTDALDRLYRAREIHEHIPHPYRQTVA